jgi:hypothetical protein
MNSFDKYVENYEEYEDFCKVIGVLPVDIMGEWQVDLSDLLLHYNVTSISQFYSKHEQ